MADVKPEKKEKPKVEAKPKEHKKHYFPKIFFVFGILLILIAINDYFNWLTIPSLTHTILILLSGIWFIKIGISKGFYKKRKEIFKKYI